MLPILPAVGICGINPDNCRFGVYDREKGEPMAKRHALKEFTSKQVADRLKVSQAMVWKYVQRRRLPIKKRVGRENYFCESDVKTLENTRKKAGRPKTS